MVFIVIDGLDASGKTTQALKLYNRFKNDGKTLCLRFHPSNDNFLGVNAKRFLYSKGKGAHLASAILYMLDVVRSILLYSWRRYEYIIFVRYLMGTAYLPSPFHMIAYHFFASSVPKSDFMFFLDVTPQEANKRIKEARQALEMFESLEELTRVRARALPLVSTGGWTVLDGNKPPEEVEREIRHILRGPF